MLGDLSIEGNYVALPEYPCLYVSGTFRCQNLYANEALTLAAGGIEVDGLLVLQYNHTVTIAPRVTAKIAVQDDTTIDGKLIAKKRMQSLHLSDYVALLGDDLHQQLNEVCSEALIGRFLSSSDLIRSDY